MRRWMVPVVGAIAGVLALGPLSAAHATPSTRTALSAAECAALVAEGEQARDDLATLIENLGDQTGVTTTTSPEIASYVADLLASAAINAFGFVSADAGAPLDLCLPKGTDTLTMFSDPVVLWQGLATLDAYPVTVVIPAGTECGTHTMRATGAGVDESVQFAVAGACTPAGTSLPRTGADIARAVAIGLSLVAIGYAVVVGRRARPTRS